MSMIRSISASEGSNEASERDSSPVAAAPKSNTATPDLSFPNRSGFGPAWRYSLPEASKRAVRTPQSFERLESTIRRRHAEIHHEISCRSA